MLVHTDRRHFDEYKPCRPHKRSGETCILRSPAPTDLHPIPGRGPMVGLNTGAASSAAAPGPEVLTHASA